MSKTMKLLIIVIGGTLLGLILLQIYLMRQSIIRISRMFDQSVYSALNTIVQRIETQEALVQAVTFKVRGFVSSREADSALISMTDNMTGIAIANQSVRSSGDQWDTIRLITVQPNPDSGFLKPHQVSITFEDTGVGPCSIRTMISRNHDPIKLKLNPIPPIQDTVHLSIPADSARSMDKRLLVERILLDLDLKAKIPVQERIQSLAVDSIIRTTLIEKNVDLEFDYGIMDSRSDSVIWMKVPARRMELKQSGFRTRLFPNDIVDSGDDLVLYFPGRRGYLLREAGMVLGLFSLFMAMLIGCMVYIVRSLVRQKDFHNALTGFVTNMAHEFKTPLSTIRLAGETMTRYADPSKGDKILKYADIIRFESNRIVRQVDRVLDMASLENGDFELRLNETNIHDLIRQVVATYSVRLEENQGQIRFELEATQPIVPVDPVHFENLLANLIDNALNYTESSPRIVIVTGNQSNRFILSVRDNGIGIPVKEQGKVFNKFYRVPTGNIHNVKGFGLGLSYVRSIVALHHGSIQLSSSPGLGSEFRITLPLKSEGTDNRSAGPVL